MRADEPVVQIEARFVDEVVAREAAEALNTWFRWILAGGEAPAPECLEPLGVRTADHAWTLGEDVDWELGPHARAVGDAVRIDLETHETQFALSGLLRALGALAVVLRRDRDL